MDGTPCLLVGDGPQEATGLGRIARDIGHLLTTESLGLDLVQVGGPVPPCWTDWPHVPMGEAERGEDWGAKYVEAIYTDRWGADPGLLFCIWDPARLYAYASIELPVRKWCYTAVDSHNRHQGLSGPPAAALQAFDRVLAYGRWGSVVIKSVRDDPVPYLPHGIWAHTYRPANEQEQAWARQQLGARVGRSAMIIGCVSTNQARKDLALYCETLSHLRARGHHVFGWLHTDTLVKDWSIQQLVEDNGLDKQITVTIGRYTDRQLACLYQACDVTLAPGLGEGFGYPIVESLASGVPVVHGDFGGGAELVPKIEWRIPITAVRRESCYALTRPVYRPEDTANAIERVWSWQDEVGPETVAVYCRGAVAHLDWGALTPRWLSWIRGGLA